MKNKSSDSTRNLSHHKSTISNLPTRPATTMRNYANIPIPKKEIDWNQSASTWRHSPYKFSFPKRKRFQSYTLPYTDIIRSEIKTTLNSKTCTFGKGQHQPISIVVLKNAQEKPAPDRYDHSEFDEQTRKKSLGKTIGVHWRSYEKVYIPYRKNVHSAFQTIDNPPAKYEVRQVSGQNKSKFSIYGRLKMFTQRMADSKRWIPGPHHQIKDRQLYGTIGLNDRSFTKGQRLDFSKPANHYPQAVYEIAGFCDKFINVKRKVSKKDDL